MKKVINCIVLVCFLILTKSFGQQSIAVQFTTAQDYASIEEVGFEYLLADKVFLRKCPSKTCKRLGNLNIGTKLVLLEKSENTSEINGIESNWYKVETADSIGWIWGGFIAQNAFGSQTDSSIKFVFGYESLLTDPDSTSVSEKYQIRAFQNGIQIDKMVFESVSVNPWEVKSIGPKGIVNVDDIIQITTPKHDECSSTTSDIYMFWFKNKFHHVADLMAKADKDYSESENFIFPSHMEGRNGVVIKETTVLNANYTEDNLDSKIQQEIIKSFYTWDGSKLSASEKKPIINTALVDL